MSELEITGYEYVWGVYFSFKTLKPSALYTGLTLGQPAPSHLHGVEDIAHGVDVGAGYRDGGYRPHGFLAPPVLRMLGLRQYRLGELLRVAAQVERHLVQQVACGAQHRLRVGPGRRCPSHHRHAY